jgi:DNA polymerase-3 subunit delta'
MILGYQKQWQFFLKLFKDQKLAHAYLFFGPPKLGKKTLALEFAKFINCSFPQNNFPCQQCFSCRAIQNRSFSDFLMIEPQNQEIQISQIRGLHSFLSLKPTGKFKIAILDHCCQMNKEAQSAFLKILEEPKGQTLLFLIAQYPNLLLPTILSRVQLIRFQPRSEAEILEFLKTKKIPQKEIQILAYFSQGKYGLLLDFINQPQLLEKEKKIIEDLNFLTRAELQKRFDFAKNLAKDKTEIYQTLESWLYHLRNKLLGKEKFPAPDYSLEKLKKIINLLQNLNLAIFTTNINPRLALEILMLEL